MKRTLVWLAVCAAGLATLGGDCSGMNDGGVDGGTSTGDGDGDGDGDPDGGMPGIEATIVAEASIVFGEEAELDASGTQNPTGGLLFFNWSISEAPMREGVSCAGELLSATQQIATLRPLCVGTYVVEVTASNASDTDSDTATHTLEVTRPNELVVMVPTVELARDVMATVTASVEGTFSDATFAWSLTNVAGDTACNGSILGATTQTATITPLCGGDHELTVVVDDGLSTETVTSTVAIVDTLNFAIFLEDPEMPTFGVPWNTRVQSVPVPAGVDPLLTEFEFAASSGSPNQEPLAVTKVADDPIRFELLSPVPHAHYFLDITATHPELPGVSYTRSDAELFPMANTLPTGSASFAPTLLNPGDTTTVTATGADIDMDDLTCSFAVGAAIGGAPETPSLTVVDGTIDFVDDGGVSECSATVDLPTGITDGWPVTVTLDDGYGTTALPDLVICPGDAPPSIDDVTVTGTGVYACQPATGCSLTEPLVVTVTASDDQQVPADLGFDIVSSDAPTGAEDTVVTVNETAHGVFEIGVSRPDLGAISGDYTFALTVNDQSTCVPGGLLTTQTVTATVINQDPAVEVVAPNVGHGWDVAEGYTATIDIDLDISDPESNSLGDVEISLSSCPEGAPGTDVCGGAVLNYVGDPLIDIVGDTATATWTLNLNSSQLPPLSGDYFFNVRVTDIDGGEYEDVVDLSILNAAPVVQSHTIDQMYNAASGLHEVSFVVATDPDGDPLTFQNLELNWFGPELAIPGTSGPSSASLIGTTATLSFDANVDHIRSHGLSGTVSDSELATDAAAFDVTIVNSPPTLTAAAQDQVRHHLTTGTTVNIDPGPAGWATFTMTSADPNGDPVGYVGYVVGRQVFGQNGTLPTEYVAAGTRTAEFDIQTTWSSYLGNANSTVSFYVTDPFGRGSGLRSVVVSYGNRVVGPDDADASIAFSPLAGDGNNEAFFPDYVDTGVPEMIYEPVYNAVGDFYEAPEPPDFRIRTQIQDPDGDPLLVAYAVTCNPAHTVVLHDTATVASLVEVPVGVTTVTQIVDILPAAAFDCPGVPTEPGRRYDLRNQGQGNYGIDCVVDWGLADDYRGAVFINHDDDSDFSVANPAIGDCN